MLGYYGHAPQSGRFSHLQARRRHDCSLRAVYLSVVEAKELMASSIVTTYVVSCQYDATIPTDCLHECSP